MKWMSGDTKRQRNRTLIRYRKICDLEQDELFLKYTQHPLFRELTRRLLGERVGWVQGC